MNKVIKISTQIDQNTGKWNVFFFFLIKTQGSGFSSNHYLESSSNLTEMQGFKSCFYSERGQFAMCEETIT